MNHTLTITPRRLIVAGLFGLLAVATYGFAASNNMSPSNAGDGSAGITGYTVSNVHYELDANNPSTVEEITFDLSPALLPGGAARISLDGGSTWVPAGDCLGTSTITCDVSGTSVLSLGNLRVVAAQ
jgi:hypothetical protein